MIMIIVLTSPLTNLNFSLSFTVVIDMANDADFLGEAEVS
jgi:hypothetical protein